MGRHDDKCPILTNSATLKKKVKIYSKCSILVVSISIYYSCTIPLKSSHCIDYGWIWAFFGSCGTGRDGTMCPWLRLSITGLCLRAFWKHLASKSCADEKVHQTPCPPSQTLTPSHLCPSISVCTVLWNPEEMIIFDSLFLCGQEQVVQQSTPPNMVYAHTRSFISRGPSILKTKPCGVKNCTEKVDFMDVS